MRAGKGIAALLAALHAGTAFGFLRFDAPLADVRDWIDRLELGYLAAMYLLGVGLLMAAYRRSSSRLLRKQVGWVLSSAAAALLPFTAIYGFNCDPGSVTTLVLNDPAAGVGTRLVALNERP